MDNSIQKNRSVNLFTSLDVLLAGSNLQSNLFMLGIGIMVSVVLVSKSAFIYYLGIEEEWVETTGILHEITEEFDEDISHELLYHYDFSFTVNNKEYHKIAYSTNKSTLKEGQPVLVEYKAQNPQLAQLAAIKEKLFSEWVALVLLFPLGMLFFVGRGFGRNIKAWSLLRNGTLTKGNLLVFEDTNVGINDAAIYSCQIAFEANNSTYHTAVCKIPVKKEMDKASVNRVLYKKENPDYNIIYDWTGNMPNITDGGQIKQAGIFSVLLLIIPIGVFYLSWFCLVKFVF